MLMGMADEEEKQQQEVSVRGWHQKPFHATGQGGRSTDERKDASAQPGLASPRSPAPNQQNPTETRDQCSEHRVVVQCLWMVNGLQSARFRCGAVGSMPQSLVAAGEMATWGDWGVPKLPGELP